MTLLKDEEGLIQELIEDAKTQWAVMEKHDPTIGTLRYLTMDDHLQWCSWSKKPVVYMENRIWIDQDYPNSDKRFPIFDPEDKYDEIPFEIGLGWLELLIDLKEGE